MEYQPVTPLDPGAKRKPALDVTGFQQLLAAAYVLQQHNDGLRAKDPRLDTSWVLSRVAETQSLLRAGGLELAAAAKLIADRLRTMTDAAGVSISLTTDGCLDCLAESGVPAKIPGSSIASHSLVATERLRNGRVFQSADAQKDIRLDMATCRNLGVRALLAVPVQRLGEVAGLVEVRWSKPDAFHESDVRTCQLMAALATEILERETGSKLSEIPQASQQPSLSSSMPLPELASDDEAVTPIPEAEDLTALPAGDPASSAAPSDSEPPAEVLAERCRVCDRPFETTEAFCGNCGMPRVAAVPSEDLQSKWASLWYMQQAQDALEERAASPASPASRFAADPLGQQTRGDFARPEAEKESQSVWRRPERTADSASPGPEAASTLFLSQDSTGTRSWDDAVRRTLQRAFRTVRLRMRRRNAILTTASLALLLILAVWGWWPAPASSHLTWFESLLVELGLAEVPPRAPAVHSGNPDVRVWVDMHTALYYCPGSDLYGKTPGGQFATQHDAQQDQFEPATGVVCE
jgi:hypothetical protein